MSIEEESYGFGQLLKESTNRYLKDVVSKFDTTDAFIEYSIKNNIQSLSSDLKQIHKSMLNNLTEAIGNNIDDAKFKDYEYFKEYCLQLKKDFKSNYKFTIVQEPTDDNFGQTIISIEIVTSIKNYSIELTNYKYHKDDRELWFDINDKDYYLYHAELGKLLSLSDAFNLTKMIKQIINQNKEHKIYKLDLRSNAKRFLLSKQPKELINEKVQITIKKIEDVKKSNFDKEDIAIFWHSYISDDRNFCDVIFALAKHEENTDIIKFNQKLEKTAKALSLPMSQLTPFLLKYLILWTEEHKGFNKHLKQLSQLIINGELEAKTNIRHVAQGKAKSNKNRFCLSDGMKNLIDGNLEKLAISDDTNYIKFLSELRNTLSNSVQKVA